MRHLSANSPIMFLCWDVPQLIDDGVLSPFKTRRLYVWPWLSKANARGLRSIFQPSKWRTVKNHRERQKKKAELALMLLKCKQAVREAARLDRPGKRDSLCLGGKPVLR